MSSPAPATRARPAGGDAAGRPASWREHVRPVLRFGLVGLLNTAVTLIVILLVLRLSGAGDVLANASGYIAGLAVSYVLNGRWTFAQARGTGDAQADRPVARLARLPAFLAVVGLAWLLNLAVVMLARNGGVTGTTAHLLGMPVYTVACYLGCRRVFTGAARA